VAGRYIKKKSGYRHVVHPPSIALVIIYTHCDNRVVTFVFRTIPFISIVETRSGTSTHGLTSQVQFASPSLEQISNIDMVASSSLDDDSNLGLLVISAGSIVYNDCVLSELSFLLVVAQVDDVTPLLA
jgi:hypothetical protein